MHTFQQDYDNATIALSRAKLIYNEFCILFLDDKHLEILRLGAESFFGLVFNEFQDSILIKLCKLTDKAENERNKNLTAEHFLNQEILIKNPEYENIKKIYDNEVMPARSKVNHYRNKYMAHSDYQKLTTLEGRKPSLNEIRELLEALEKYFGEISIHCLGTTHFFGGLPLRSGAGYLVKLLERANNDISDYNWS
jgi:hypothetical protein